MVNLTNIHFIRVNPTVIQELIQELVADYDVLGDIDTYTSVVEMMVSYTYFKYQHLNDQPDLERDQDITRFILEGEGVTGVNPEEIFQILFDQHYHYLLSALVCFLSPYETFTMEVFYDHTQNPLDIYQGVIVSKEPHGLG